MTITTLPIVADNAVRYLKAADGSEDRSRVGGHLVVFTGPEHRDLYGEFFTAKTDYGLDRWPIRPLMYQHGFDAVLRDAPVGVLDTLKADGVGLWAEAQLDLHHEYIDQLRWLIDQSALGWSSGALPQGVYVDANGEIKRWPVIEGSLTPTPAEPLTIGDVTYTTPASVRRVGGGYVYDTTAEHVTRAYKSAGLSVPDLLERAAAAKGGAERERAGEENASGDSVGDLTETDPPERGETKTMSMTEEQVRELFEAWKADEAAKAERAALEAKAAKAEQLETELRDLKAKTEGDQQPAKRLPGRETEPEETGGANPNKGVPGLTVGSKFDHLTAVDMAWGLSFLHAVNKSDRTKGQVSEQFGRALAEKVQRENLSPVKLDGTPYKANELSHSTQANYGDEWVPDLWSSELWRKARNENVVLPLFRVVEMPSNPYELPIEASDPTVHYVPETTEETHLALGSGNPMPDSKIGSGKVQLSAKKLALRVGFSSELVEDSIIPILPMYREQAMQAMADGIDHVLLNGDTTATATGNINLDDDTPGATNKYLAFDGLRHLPLVTTTAQALDAAGGPSLAALRKARFAMPMRYSLRPGALAWLVDGASYGKLLSLDEIVTLDKYGPAATVMTGEIGRLDGIPVLASAEMPLTEADGKVSKTGANNTKGQAVCVYRPGWVVGYRRRIAASVDYLPYYDSYQMVATVRLAFVNFDAYVASALYNIAI
mgnify:CR=1 FL=1